MEDQSNLEIQLQCSSCESTDIDLIEENTKIKCNQCGRIYHGGIDELEELNKKFIEKQIEIKLESKIISNLQDSLKGNKNIKII